jgi:hypothetical protein
MKIMIEGDTEHAHLVAASKAIDEHKKNTGLGINTLLLPTASATAKGYFRLRSPIAINITWPTSLQATVSSQKFITEKEIKARFPAEFSQVNDYIHKLLLCSKKRQDFSQK